MTVFGQPTVSYCYDDANRLTLRSAKREGTEGWRQRRRYHPR
jgi:hypothetical protein